jgi:hypothetical protein
VRNSDTTIVLVAVLAVALNSVRERNPAVLSRWGIKIVVRRLMGTSFSTHLVKTYLMI